MGLDVTYTWPNASVIIIFRFTENSHTHTHSHIATSAKYPKPDNVSCVLSLPFRCNFSYILLHFAHHPSIYERTQTRSHINMTVYIIRYVQLNYFISNPENGEEKQMTMKRDYSCSNFRNHPEGLPLFCFKFASSCHHLYTTRLYIFFFIFFHAHCFRSNFLSYFVESFLFSVTLFLFLSPCIFILSFVRYRSDKEQK